MSKPKQSNKLKNKVVSFNLDEKTYLRLKELPKYTTFIAALLNEKFNICPVCNGPWGKTKKV